MAERRPFHQTVIDAIRLASSSELVSLASLIKATKIPQGHDDIISAWSQRICQLYLGEEDFGVMDDLRAQKQEAERAKAALAKAPDASKSLLR